MLINGGIIIAFGDGSFQNEVPAPGPRDEDESYAWFTIRGVVDGEFDLTSRLILRFGAGGTYNFLTLVMVPVPILLQWILFPVPLQAWGF